MRRKAAGESVFDAVKATEWRLKQPEVAVKVAVRRGKQSKTAVKVPEARLKRL
jgi:hypothetical protein